MNEVAPLLLTWSGKKKGRGGYTFHIPKQRIQNINYRQFLDVGLINVINEDQLRQALSNIKGMRGGRYVTEGRALLIALYYTGARPNEVLALRGKDVTKEGQFVRVFLKGSKRGLPRPVYLRLKKSEVQELFKYASSLFPDLYLFFHYKNTYIRHYLNKKGDVKEKVEVTDKIRGYVSKWFTGVIEGSITPYYLRHNRFSKLSMAGASLQELRMIKGSKTEGSVTPYLHLSTRTSKALAKKID